MRKFNNKVAVVTGGAKGIGRSIIEKYSLNGATTVILDFDEVSGQELCQDIMSKGGESLFIRTDVTSYQNLTDAKDQIIASYGKIDYLVINAGISYKHRVEEITIDEWNKIINTNLNSSFYTLKAFWDNIIINSEAKVVFVTSGSAITGTGGGAHYAASKAGQHGLMRAVSKELGPLGINVNAIAPRVIESAILEHLYPTEESRKELIEKIPIRKIGQPEDIANLTMFLSSEESGYIHGQIILADGGRTY